MCHQNTGLCYDRPIAQKDVLDIFNFYQLLPGGEKVSLVFIQDVFDAIKDSNSPQPIVLVALVELYFRKANGFIGKKYPWVALPFSALNYETGERLMSPKMGPFHGVFAMFSLAQRNLGLLRNKLEKYGVDFITFHDCGCFMPDRDDNDIMETQIYQDINLVRSHYEALGGAVRNLSFDQPEWKSPYLDMGSEEINSYLRMDDCLKTLKAEVRNFYTADKINAVKKRIMPNLVVNELLLV